MEALPGAPAQTIYSSAVSEHGRISRTRRQPFRVVEFRKGNDRFTAALLPTHSDTTTALLLGRSVYSLRAKDLNDTGNKAFAEHFDIAQGGLAKRFRLAPWHSLYSPPQFRRSCSIVHHFLDDYILERGVHHGKGNGHKSSESFVDQLAQESGSHEMLRDQLLNILLAGRDTTACCLSWTL